ncbi:hypothetical protein FOZ62_012881 [Perkinsus olseni]|uniref:Uncharacterized protein n=1 Tax=Perkinsus olseni TaxID=32597 RepID=A0A7J6QL62_PEROL|nr:hypothetical protein FOZ62_012881 [Perkinsus olseni]
MLEMRLFHHAREIESLREQLAIAELNGPKDELKGRLMEMVKKNRSLTVSLHSKEARIKALMVDLATANEGKGKDEGVDVVEANEYKNKYMKMANEMQSLRQDLSSTKGQVSRMKKILVAEIGDQATVEEVISGGSTEGYEGRSKTIVRLKREVRALRMQMKLLENKSVDRHSNAWDSPSAGPTGEQRPQPSQSGWEGPDKSMSIGRLAEERRNQLSELQRKVVELKGRLKEAQKIGEAVKSRSRILTERNAELKEQIATLLEKSDGDDRLIAEMRGYLDRKIGRADLPSFPAEGVADDRTVYYPELERLRSENETLKEQCRTQKTIIETVGRRPSPAQQDRAPSAAELKDTQSTTTGKATTNDVHPLIAYGQLGRWSLSNREYGGHYYHPEQEYKVAQNPRMPNLVVSRSQLDRFRADPNLMFD